MKKMVQLCYPNNSGYPRRYLSDRTLNPDRVDRYWVQAPSKKRAVELLGEHTGLRLSMYALRTYGHDCWGTAVVYPAHKGEGVWVTRDLHSTELVPVWTSEQQQ